MATADDDGAELILALYPQFADADAITQTRLIGAWFRRKRLEARLIAVEVGKLFGPSAGSGAGPSAGSGAGAGGYEMIDEASALAALGVPVRRFEVGNHATTG